MANRHRGEVEAVVDGRPRRLRLTLGALADLESAFGADDLVALAERFATGRLSARDLVAVLAAGLCGAGEAVTAEDVAGMAFEGGAVGAAEAAARLLAATFGTSAEAGRPAPGEGAGDASDGPFPGRRRRASRGMR